MPGQRVDLVEDDRAVLGEEHVHPRESPASQGAIDGLRRLLDERARLGRDVGGNDRRRVFGAAFRLALLMDPEEAVRQGDSIHLAGDQIRTVPQDGASDLAADDRLLDQHLRVVLPRGFHRTRPALPCADTLLTPNDEPERAGFTKTG